MKRDKEGHYIMIKGTIQEDITIINIYAPNIGIQQYLRKDAWNDFNCFEFTKARFMAQDVIYPGEGSVCT